MNFGFENGKFYIDHYPCKRSHGNLKEEHNNRTFELAQTGSKFILSCNGNIDSQAILYTFYKYDIPIETAFMYLPKYNDQEYGYIKILDKKYNRKTWIVDLDPYKVKEEILETSLKLNLSNRYDLLIKKFLSLLPNDYDFIQTVQRPSVILSNHKPYLIQSYNMPEITRMRAVEELNRKGKNIFYNNSSEFLMSIINDEIFRSSISSFLYYDGNGLTHTNTKLKIIDKFEYYVKPLIYAYYFRDELIYFPKFTGLEKIDYLQEDNSSITKNHTIAIDYRKFLEFNNKIGNHPERFYENTFGIEND